MSIETLRNGPDAEAMNGGHYRLTDMGNAERLVARFGDDLRWCAAWGCWLVWTGSRWRRDETGEAERLAKKAVLAIYREAAYLAESQDERARELAKKVADHAKSSERSERINAMLKLARSEPGIAVTPDMLDADVWLFNTMTGTLDLRTFELRDHDRLDLITKLSPVTFNPEAACPVYDAFIRRIMHDDDDLIEYLERLLAWCLTGDIRHHVLPIFYGGGANGKSSLLDVVLFILAEYGCPAPDSLITARHADEHPTETARLAGMRLAAASETEEGRKLRVGLVKRLTGDEHLTGRYMRCDYFTFKRTFKIILCTNNRPRVSENTAAIWRRVKLIPFTVTIPEHEQDPDLPNKLKAEASGILARLVRACRRWRDSGFDLAEPDVVRQATEEYQADEDTLGEFIETNCILAEWAKVSRSDLWEAYQRWATQSGDKFTLSRRGLYERVRKLDGVSDGQMREGGAMTRCFQGLGLAFGGEA